MQNNELTGEPAVWAALVGSAVQLVAAFFLPLSNDMVAGLNAVVIAAAGIWMAVATRSADSGPAGFLGFAEVTSSPCACRSPRPWLPCVHWAHLG